MPDTLTIDLTEIEDEMREAALMELMGAAEAVSSAADAATGGERVGADALRAALDQYADAVELAGQLGCGPDARCESLTGKPACLEALARYALAALSDRVREPGNGPDYSPQMLRSVADRWEALDRLLAAVGEPVEA